jgi:hypothetical protein
LTPEEEEEEITKGLSILGSFGVDVVGYRSPSWDFSAATEGLLQKHGFLYSSNFMDDLKPLGLDMARSLVRALGGDWKVVEGYGKGAIVGSAGEIEHGALWHVPGGYGMREVLGGAKAIVASTKKVGGPGTRLDIPITHINASYVRSHFDAVEVGMTDSPRADEILLALVMTTGPRVHARVGGLKASDIKGEDGLR